MAAGTTPASADGKTPEHDVSLRLVTPPGGTGQSSATAQGGSFSGSDVRTAAARLINEEADSVVAKLYSDYCTNAGTVETKAEPRRKK